MVVNSKKLQSLPFRSLKVILGPLDLSSEFWRWNRPIPNCYNLWIALEGRAELITLGKTYPIHPGTCFVFSPYQEISAKSTSEKSFRNFACRFLPTDGVGDILKEKVIQLMGVESSNFFGIRDLCQAAIRAARFDDALASQQTAGICFQILAQVWRDANMPAIKNPDALVFELMESLRNNPAKRLTIMEMANEARMSISKLSRKFQLISGETPMDYAIKHRILKSQKYLHGSCLQIQEIADALGYSDIYFFSRQFKQITGVSPSEYRKMISAPSHSALPETATAGMSQPSLKVAGG